MAQIHTHYDTLKIAPDAPPEVIRAAYKTLSMKFHPDRNPDNPAATKIMARINTAYDVLSDPDQRQKYDSWIIEQENQAAQANRPSFLSRNWIFYLLAISLIVIAITIKDKINSPKSKPYRDNPVTARSAKYVKPATAPNGSPWPISADYVAGYDYLNADGLSIVTVDNSRNNSDVFVKLVSLDGVANPVRQFYIPALGKFTLNDVTAGSYDIRYKNLENGRLSRSEKFDLKEIETDVGTKYSNMTISLHRVQDGNLRTYGLPEAEF
ncbi:MAG: J domain-containing protein [Azonexus sp.]|jgi:curved DNA-binding protein CbpA|nr:J domain-containing protein [Azonexus sp.]